MAGLLVGGGSAWSAWTPDTLPPHIRWTALAPQDIAIDTRRRWSACHGAAEQLYYRPADEAVAMRATRTARRDGGRLIVGAASFHDRTFEGDEAEGADYSYVGRYRTIPIHLVHVQYYEGDGWILVDPFSGAHVELADIPLLAPDRRTFAAVSDADAYNFHGIQVVEWRRRRFGPVAEVEARYPCDAAWRRRGELALRVLEGESVSEGSAWRPAVVRRSRGAVWRLMPR